MNNHAVDAMMYAWTAMKEKEVTMEYIDLGKVTNISTSVPTAVDDVTYHVIMDFVPDGPAIFDRLREGFSDILNCPDAWVLCNVGDITKTQDELLKLKDRVKELEGQLADAKKESDKKLCEVYMETNATLYDGVYRLIAIDKELEDLKKQAEQMEDLEKENQSLKVKNGDLFKERGVLQAKLVKRGVELECIKSENSELKKELKDLKSKTVAEVRYEWKPNCFTVIYTMRDGSKQTAGMDLAGDIDEKCKNCKNHRYFGNTFGHCCCIPNSNHIIPGMFDMYPLTDEEAEGPACDKFEARKE